MERYATYSDPLASVPARLPVLPLWEGRPGSGALSHSVAKFVRSSFFPCGQRRCLHNTRFWLGFFPLLHHFPETEGVVYFFLFMANNTYGSLCLFQLYGDVVIYNQILMVFWVYFAL